MMNQDELTALRSQADAVHNQDVHLGRFLHSLIDHLARLSSPAIVAKEDDTSPKLKAVAKGDITNAN